MRKKYMSRLRSRISRLNPSWLVSKMGKLWACVPTQGDEKRLLFGNYCPWKHHPPLCHLDRSAAQWRDLRSSGPFLEIVFRHRSYGPACPPKAMESGSCSATIVPGSTTLPFVISTGAQRSGEICGPAVLPWECFSTAAQRSSLPGSALRQSL